MDYVFVDFKTTILWFWSLLGMLIIPYGLYRSMFIFFFTPPIDDNWGKKRKKFYKFLFIGLLFVITVPFAVFHLNLPAELSFKSPPIKALMYFLAMVEKILVFGSVPVLFIGILRVLTSPQDKRWRIGNIYTRVAGFMGMNIFMWPIVFGGSIALFSYLFQLG